MVPGYLIYLEPEIPKKHHTMLNSPRYIQTSIEQILQKNLILKILEIVKQVCYFLSLFEQCAMCSIIVHPRTEEGKRPGEKCEKLTNPWILQGGRKITGMRLKKRKYNPTSGVSLYPQNSPWPTWCLPLIFFQSRLSPSFSPSRVMIPFRRIFFLLSSSLLYDSGHALIPPVLVLSRLFFPTHSF